MVVTFVAIKSFDINQTKKKINNLTHKCMCVVVFS